MTNFVLVDAPNFVLLASPPEAEEQPATDEPLFLNPLFTDLLQRLGLRLAAQPLSSPLAFSDAAAPVMRRILVQYGFDLPPLTVGELYGLLEYCDRLDAHTGKGLFATHQQAQWQALSFTLGPSGRSPCQQALMLYAQGDAQGLRALHRARRTLSQLGRQFRAAEG